MGSANHWYKTFFSTQNFESEKNYFLTHWQLAAHINEIKNEFCIPWTDGFISLVKTSVVQARYHQNSSHPIALEIENVNGFLFVKIPDDKNDQKKLKIDFQKKTEGLSPLESATEKIIDVNWKLLVDISLDETHVDSIHPEFANFLGGAYDYAKQGSLRSWKQRLQRDGQKRSEDVQKYHRLLQWLYPESQHYWEYQWIFPATEIEVYPEQISYYQIIPLNKEKSLKRHCRLGVGTYNPLILWMRKINKKIQEQIDQQDIDAVIKRQKVTKSIEAINLFPGQDDGLVSKFHEIVRS